MRFSATPKPKLELVDMEEGDPRLVADLYPVLHELRFKLTEEQLQSGVEGMCVWNVRTCHISITDYGACVDLV